MRDSMKANRWKQRRDAQILRKRNDPSDFDMGQFGVREKVRLTKSERMKNENQSQQSV